MIREFFRGLRAKNLKPKYVYIGYERESDKTTNCDRERLSNSSQNNSQNLKISFKGLPENLTIGDLKRITQTYSELQGGLK